MKLQPNRDYVHTTNDDIQTPVELAGRLVRHLKPEGRVLEPCKGGGAFLQHLPGAEWCEIKEGRCFYEWNQPVDWVITNPPWSQIRRFLQHAMAHARDVAFLLTINHLWTRARVRDIAEAGFGTKEIILLDMPENFPQSGFQLGMVHLQRDWTGPAAITNWTEPSLVRARGRKRSRKRSDQIDPL